MAKTLIARPIHCPSLCLPDRFDWSDTAKAFADSPSLHLRQAWLPSPEPDFSAGQVFLGATEDALLIYAVLKDRDIFNDERELNALSFLCGDVFEIFLRAVGRRAYFEFHISPHNQKLQLCWPSAQTFRSAQLDDLECFKLREPVLRSRTLIERDHWRVFAEIPFPLVAGFGKVRATTRWKGSFSRYDYSRTRNKPVLSSTSPHKKCDFHRQDEWGELVFGNQTNQSEAFAATNNNS